ncbi:MAG TPA: SDR family oxidoreductase [Gammaproteobacteria bacterium]|nr:SDR family oxidoreductase [Gammaproteobacteria bacterium]
MTTRGNMVITGASTGIGEACALHFARAGFTVYAGVRNDSDAGRLQRSSPNLQPALLDVTVESSIERAIEHIAAQTGAAGLCGLVNNAGIAVAAPLECVSLGKFRRQLEVNVIGALAVTQRCLPLLRQGRGRIVNMSSVSGLVAPPFVGPYAASKFALEALSDALRLELKPWRIHVAVVEPGPVATPIWQKSRDAVAQFMEDLPPTYRMLYGQATQQMARVMEDAAGAAVPADWVVAAVEHALLSPRPRTRYLASRGMRFTMWLSRLLPDRWRDRGLLKHYGLPD